MYAGRKVECVPLRKRDVAKRLKLLALHGSGSNSDVTRMQLENLGLPEAGYEIVYMNGPILVEEPGHGVAEIDGLVSGPWYAWLPRGAGSNDLQGEALLLGICEAIYSVLTRIKTDGPFDGVFGFSQGGIIASMINSLPDDKALASAFQMHMGISIAEMLHGEMPFNAAIIACAAAPSSLPQLRLQAGLGPIPAMTSRVRSLHLIGRNDNFKHWSEAFAQSFNPFSTQVYYLAGGHEISKLQSGAGDIINVIDQCFAITNELDAPPASFDHKWLSSSRVSARSLAKDVQVASVKLATNGLPETIVEMLAAQPTRTPLFRLARETDANAVTTYGQVLTFCSPGGDGDLRRLGVHAGDVVAYLAPPGGSAVSAVAFLSIAAQTCAVPFASHMSEIDALLALEQYGVKHMIIFDDVAAPGVRTAFANYARKGNALLHYTNCSDISCPGLFKYQNSISEFLDRPELANPPMAYSLLLRTSGTTSLPKVVPLRQRDLVLNAAILADGIGITREDVTYSVMPLDHIGGISASILCSLAVGASVTCDGPYNPQGMVEALMESNPRPTWYSAVPTIHNATVQFLRERSDLYLDHQGQWQEHRLRMIRSGAAALKETDRYSLEAVFGVEVVSTYSMSELMPICQPPRIVNSWKQKPGAVGVPVTASMAIVDPVSLCPLPFGKEGEIAISGETIFSGYMNNADANMQSRFLLKSANDQLTTWFLTGDLGEMDAEGTLTIRGRIKELIKRGGEQIAPAEVEDLLVMHPLINTAVCFSVPSATYGEEVGCALVLEQSAPNQPELQEIIREMKTLLKQKGLASHKFPSLWKLVAINELPQTASKKYIRKNLADILGMTVGVDKGTASVPTAARQVTHSIKQRIKPTSEVADFHNTSTATTLANHHRPKIDWNALAGFRFILACYVMFMHIGSNASWSGFSNLRQFPWHVHAFFAVAGFSLAVAMPALINKRFSFIAARVSGMYPLYGLAILFGLGNLLVSCQPSTFVPYFHWSTLLATPTQPFCQGTPLLQDSWWANLFSTLGIYITGLQATPLWGASWFVGFYLWFISMYFQCLILFPFTYNALYKNRGRTLRLLGLTLLTLIVNLVIVLGFWFGFAIDGIGYGLFDPLTGLRTIPSADQIAMAGKDNAIILGFFLFAPFWMVYFVAGMCAAFLFDAVRPSRKLWGYIADGITLVIIAVSAAHVAQGFFPYGPDVKQVALDAFFMRPEAANSFADPSAVNRIWDNVYARLFAPLTLLWIFAISTGQGWTAKALRFNPLSQTLAPTAYACFLFHQMVGQWYYAATRNGEWWNWWNYQKDYYWFSPQPVPVEWYEYFYVVGLVVFFSKLVQPLDPLLRRNFVQAVNYLKSLVSGRDAITATKDTLTIILQVIQRATGMEAKAEWSLEECGLASLGIVQFINTLETEFSTSTHKIRLPVPDIMATRDINEIATIVDTVISDAQQQPINGNGLSTS